MKFFISVFLFIFSFVSFSEAQAAEKFTIENNTDATLWIFYQRAASVSTATSIPPRSITTLNNYLPAGGQTVYLETRYVRPPRTATGEFQIQYGDSIRNRWVVTNQTFNVSFMSDPPGVNTPDLSNNAGGNNTCSWAPAGQGDVAGHDIGNSRGSSVPSLDHCTPDKQDFGAVCWSSGKNAINGPWCTYKNLPYSQVKGGANTGSLYRCQC